MSILGTFNGWNIVSLPSDTIDGVRGPSSIEWEEHEAVAANESPFTGQVQVYDWGASWWQGTVSFPQMARLSHDAWSAFLSEVRGGLNVFQLGDPRAAQPKGTAAGVPLVNGASQSGYSLATKGWTASSFGLLLPGDYIQIGYRMYKVVDQVNSDASGDATLSIWPPLREAPADGAAIQCANCKGLFRLVPGTVTKHSVNIGVYGLSAFQIREAI